MTPPIVVTEHGDISFYPAVAAAALALEPIDVRNNEYVVYDSEGYKLKLVPGTTNVMIIGRINEKPVPEALHRALRSFWESAAGEPVPVGISSIEQLLSLCVQRFGYAR